MAEIVRMPKMSDTMEEGVIAVWHKKVGDQVESGELMAEIETDKATMDYESFNDGTVLYLGAEEGEAVAVDGILAIVGKEGEDYKALLNDNGSTSEEKEEEAPKEEKSAPAEKAEKIDTSSINAEIVRMPKMSDTMEEGVIASWLKKVGDSVESGELMAEIETDKATMEYESYNDGTVLYLGAKEGESVKVDGILAIVGEEGADYEALIKADQQGGSSEEKAEEPADEPQEKTESASSTTNAAPAAESSNSNGRVKASPLAKKLAEDKGIDLGQVKGSGDGGRIIKRDIENFTPTQKAAAPEKAEESAKSAPAIELPKVVGEESFEEMRVSQMRKTIAKRLAQSKFTAPHFYLTMEINMDKAIEARKSMNEISPVKISFNDMVIKAAAVSLRQHKMVNASWLDDKIRINHHVHVGVAVAVDEGLLVPVVKFADNKPLSHISAEVKELGGKAKSKKLQPEEMQGNTFTISNLGMFGIEEFTAIINPPDSCIMAVGGIKETAIVKNGELSVGNIMKVTLSCDHRVVDGAVGSAFLQTFKGLLEDPVRILV
ncbi:MAG: pyruvate dehydrogenase complex dihydrolipoamide acetyltransferase [Roseivirga sp.]|jgi:pyruvate dehydrogenase E2 component (dihydrolipoamide acetyltransferase)|uniref:pyruvate dehydrogenase complex dihydrolipoamide acetyltransferase n=1 Tax=Roseivirga sp. TaxID=1964215 RepID=UPI001B1D6218|nr:pyruvate dehydrogenase complex dihydrolipoamide acetyltransferase [Roseivirga sp.]MBO6659456.1 pyruvate dehydrogenase complex dihydrolipoamide acetyltransferase [Roseivirga sp.]MBO6759630.1 pyruvate dehydrogenase complex dihydrolipoamide acetyltransferase [Roseivirga sp.]MBO6907807.1 pyruvate dehydrogenase complex dihydrolipoamide acetyltransferase [Roseivirga sp.]